MSDDIFTVKFIDRKRSRKVVASSPEDAAYKASRKRVLLVMPVWVELSGFSHLFDVTVKDNASTVQCLVIPENREKWVSKTSRLISYRVAMDMVPEY